MKFRCRRHVTLLEVLIAMSLTLVILSTLTYFYRQVNIVNFEMDKAQNKSFQRRYVENRLASILPKAIPETDNSKDFHFFSSPDLGGLFKEGSSSLVFTFDNCVKLNKNFTYHVIGRLYLDPEGNFTLALWPPKSRWKENEPPPMHKEILLRNVETLDFTFFMPPEKGRTNLDDKPRSQEVERPLGSEGGWAREWRGEYRQLPAIVKIELTLENEKKITFAFPLPNTKQPITYDG